VHRTRLTIPFLGWIVLAILVGLTCPGCSSHTPGHASVAAAGASPQAHARHASATESLSKLISLGHPIYCAGRRGREVALTFDDGPGPYTELALRKLRKHGMRATFFIVGRNIALLPRAIRQERSLGAVGDHTYTHPVLTSLSYASARQQILRTKQALEHAASGPIVLFRPPYGAHNSSIDHLLRRHRLLEILWSVDSADSLGANHVQIAHNVISGLHPGAIILMHENHGQTIRALLSIFAAIKRKHLRAVSVPQLLAEDPPDPRALRASASRCL
jgi:peptidoglycan-N-acetylglucosamine deacetylase